MVGVSNFLSEEELLENDITYDFIEHLRKTTLYLLKLILLKPCVLF